MTAKFILYRDKAGKFRFRLKAPNSEIIAVGEAYESKESCLKGIRSIQKNAAAAIEDLTLGLPRSRRAAEVTAAEVTAAEVTAAEVTDAKVTDAKVTDAKEAAAPARESAPREMAAALSADWRPEPAAGGFMRCNCVSCRGGVTR